MMPGPSQAPPRGAMMSGPGQAQPRGAVMPGLGAVVSYGVLFASFDSAEQAKQGWQQIWNQHWSVLSGVTAYIEYGTVGNSATRFHLYGKTVTRDHASRLCQGLRQRGAACAMVSF